MSIGAAWEQRWDSAAAFHSGALQRACPACRFPGERYSVPTKDEVADYLKAYAERFDLPVRLRTRVSSAPPRRRELTRSAPTGGESLGARSIIVATGANQQPYVPRSPRAAGRNRADSLELATAGRRSFPPAGAGRRRRQFRRADRARAAAGSGAKRIAVRPRHRLAAAAFLGRDIYDWLWPTLMRPSVESAIGRRLMRGRFSRAIRWSACRGTSTVQALNLTRVGKTIRRARRPALARRRQCRPGNRCRRLVHRLPARLRLDRATGARPRRLSGASAAALPRDAPGSVPRHALSVPHGLGASRRSRRRRRVRRVAHAEVPALATAECDWRPGARDWHTRGSDPSRESRCCPCR